VTIASGVEHSNPSTLSSSKGETRATEYSKAATRGSWNDVWDNFDRRRKAKADAAANDGASASDGPDMFEAAGVAAE
jgi:ribonucleoside-diphosphate reductase beta chain